MKRLMKTIQAAEDFRSFDGFSLDEIEEMYPDYEDWGVDLTDAKVVYLPRNDENPYIGIEYDDGEVWVFGGRKDVQVSFEELCDYMKQ